MADEPAQQGTPLRAFARGEREERVLGPTRGVRKLGSGILLFVAVLLPTLVLGFDPLGYTLVCDPDEAACHLTVQKAFREHTRSFSFDDIESVGYHGVGKVRHRDGSYSSNGETYFALHLKTGEKVVATTSTASIPVPWARAHALVTRGEGERLEARTRVGIRQFLSLGGIILGLVFIALLCWWRTVVVIDRGPGVVTVEKRRPPLLRKVLAHVEARDVVDATKSGVENKWFVEVKLAQGREDRLGPFANGNVASELCAVLRAEGRGGRG